MAKTVRGAQKPARKQAKPGLGKKGHTAAKKSGIC